MPKVSVIIPCFNQGAYLAEAVGSVLAQTLDDLEIIVVNDGSTEPETRKILESFRAPKTQIVHSANQGLSAARNLGISRARGAYILPLDCDDKIAPTYLAQAAALLDQEPALGIVYCKAEYCGFQAGPWMLPPFRFPDFLIHPSIFCSALYRRSDWAECGGYSVDLKDGYEDHDFWVHLVKRGRKVHCINQVLFHYRRMPNSMTDALTLEKHVAAFATIFRHHQDLFVDNIDVLLRAAFVRDAQAAANSNHPVIQVFADAGKGYNEFDSMRTRYSAGDWVVTNLPLPPAASTQRIPLRLDPGMQAGCYDIIEVALLQAGRTVAVLRPESTMADALIKVEGTALRLPTTEGIRIFSYGTDPRISLPGLALPPGADALRVRLRFQASIESAADSFGKIQQEVDAIAKTPPAGFVAKSLEQIFRII